MPVFAQTPRGCRGDALPIIGVALKAAVNILACNEEGNLGKVPKKPGHHRYFTYFYTLY